MLRYEDARAFMWIMRGLMWFVLLTVFFPLIYANGMGMLSWHKSAPWFVFANLYGLSMTLVVIALYEGAYAEFRRQEIDKEYRKYETMDPYDSKPPKSD